MDRVLDNSELLLLTAQHLVGWPAVESMEVIQKGGSDRNFYRLRFHGEEGSTLILMTYTLNRPDNPRFVPATLRLQKLGVRVPAIISHDPERLCVWLEDLGADDLHGFRDKPWETRRGLYQAALDEAAKLHQVDAAGLHEQDLSEMELCFDEQLYEWEQGYFLKHFVGGVLGRDINLPEYAGGHEALRLLRVHLASLPRGLVHRDFQSQNVIIREGRAWLIDYQGVRPGLPGYDVASLLLDPYVDLEDSEREDLLHWYAAHTNRDHVEFTATFHLCAAQRLMQALGAYANLSRNLGKPHFKQHIPAGVQRLLYVCSRHPMLKQVADFVREPEPA